MIYAVITTARTGGSLLQDWLASTRVLGFRGHWRGLGPRQRQRLDKAGFEQMIRATRTPNGVFGVKLSSFYAMAFLRHYTPDLLVHLYREDLLRQAISKCRAIQTGVWLSSGGGQDHAKLHYSYEQIVRHARAIRNQHRRIAALEPELTFSYEQLCQDPRKWIRRIARRLGVRLRPYRLSSVLEIQRDELTERWARQFAKDVRRKDRQLLKEQRYP